VLYHVGVPLCVSFNLLKWVLTSEKACNI